MIAKVRRVDKGPKCKSSAISQSLAFVLPLGMYSCAIELFGDVDMTTRSNARLYSVVRENFSATTETKVSYEIVP